MVTKRALSSDDVMRRRSPGCVLSWRSGTPGWMAGSLTVCTLKAGNSVAFLDIEV